MPSDRAGPDRATSYLHPTTAPAGSAPAEPRRPVSALVGGRPDDPGEERGLYPPQEQHVADPEQGGDQDHGEQPAGEEGVAVRDEEVAQAREADLHLADDHADDGQPGGHPGARQDIGHGGGQADLPQHLGLGQAEGRAQVDVAAADIADAGQRVEQDGPEHDQEDEQQPGLLADPDPDDDERDDDHQRGGVEEVHEGAEHLLHDLVAAHHDADRDAGRDPGQAADHHLLERLRQRLEDDPAGDQLHEIAPHLGGRGDEDRIEVSARPLPGSQHGGHRHPCPSARTPRYSMIASRISIARGWARTLNSQRGRGRSTSITLVSRPGLPRNRAMRSLRKIASSTSWVTKTTVVPSFAQSLAISIWRVSRVKLSRWPNGSSIRSTWGSMARALATPTRCCMPTESV